MINLQFHHNKVTYKKFLKFLGLVIKIQIKAINRSEYLDATFPSKKMQVVSFTSYNTKQLYREDREILQRNQGPKHINMELEEQQLASVSLPLVGKRTRGLKARLDDKAEIDLLLSLSMDFYAWSTSRNNWSNVQNTCLCFSSNILPANASKILPT